MVADPASIEDAVQSLARLHLDEPLETTLSQVAGLACRTLRSCDLANVVLIRDGRAGGGPPDHDVRAELRVPLVARDEPVGMLNLYSTSHDAFTLDDEEVARAFCELAAVACANAEVYWRCREMTDHLREAVETRDVIGQAKGVLMVRHGYTPEQAFDALREASMKRNVKLRLLAEEVVYTGELRV